ncbi:hypothetical protein BIY30_07325 [Gibbsiella quercinecans]|nr:hypothetical protein BIY30_07325 [Gibbsiella quercinecans]
MGSKPDDGVVNWIVTGNMLPVTLAEVCGTCNRLFSPQALIVIGLIFLVGSETSGQPPVTGMQLLPHPSPLPGGEGADSAYHWVYKKPLTICRCTGLNAISGYSLSLEGEGWGEGKGEGRGKN